MRRREHDDGADLSLLERLPLIGWPVPGQARKLAAARVKVRETAATLRIGPLLGRKPVQLSGRRRQRVALGRAKVRHPVAFLMDEPPSNLDAARRVHMRAELAKLHRQLGTTFVYVTHDQSEAQTMSVRVAVMMGARSCDSRPRTRSIAIRWTCAWLSSSEAPRSISCPAPRTRTVVCAR